MLATLIAAAFSSAVAAGPKSFIDARPKLVFANYMVCNRDYSDSIASYEHDIRDAQSYGIDGFVLDETSWAGTNCQPDTESIFQAAAALHSGFKLCFMVEGEGGPEIVQLVRQYASSPSYYRYHGRPLLVAWAGQSRGGGGSGAANWWRSQVLDPLRTGGLNVYFVPDFYCADFAETPKYQDVLTNYNAWWSYVADGMFYFGAAGLPSYSPPSLLSSSESFASIVHGHGKTYMACCSPQYWGSKQPDRRYFEYQGGIGLTAQWKSIIQVQKPEWVNLVTWNDFDEATHFSPIDDVNKYWPYVAHTTPGFYQNRSGILKLTQYFITWYKRYPANHPPPPPGGKDTFYYIYRTQPKSMTTSDPVGPVHSFIGDVQDNLYLTTILKKSAMLRVRSGGARTSYAVPAGLSTTVVQFSPGEQRFEIDRNGKTVLSGSGPTILSQANAYNYIYTSGWLQEK